MFAGSCASSGNAVVRPAAGTVAGRPTGRATDATTGRLGEPPDHDERDKGTTADITRERILLAEACPAPTGPVEVPVPPDEGRAGFLGSSSTGGGQHPAGRMVVPAAWAAEEAHLSSM